MSVLPSAPEIVWYRRDWSTIMLKHRGEWLTYLRGNCVHRGRTVALRVNGADHEWTDVRREAFKGPEPPATITVEVATRAGRPRSASAYEYRQPRPEAAPSTPGPRL